MNSLLAAPPCWYWIIATVMTLYQGARGWYFQWRLAHEQNRQAAVASPAAPQEPGWAIRWMRCLEDLVLYAVSSAAGFAALWLAWRTLIVMNSSSEAPSTGAGTVLAFFATVGVVGVSGQLPLLIQLGKIK